MNTKFTAKQLILVVIMVIALVAPRYPWYLSLNLESQVKFSIKFAISLIIVWIIIVLLVRDYRKDEKKLVEKDENLYSDVNSVKNVVINHNYQKVNQRYQWKFSKLKNIKQDVNNIKFEKISINDEFRVMQRLRELETSSFEEFIEKLFELKGYSIDKEPNYYWNIPQVDWWKDLIIHKNNKVYYVQIKKYFRKMVPLADLQAFNQVLKNWSWFFVTVSVFSEPAKKFSKGKDFKCIDYKSIWNVINKLSSENKKELELFINDSKNIQTNFEYKPRTCKICWAPMKRRQKLGGYGCLRYPECNCREFLK